MRAIMPNLSKNADDPLYIQLYAYLRDEILAGRAVPGEKLPSLRNLSSSLHISLTTAAQAYDQLAVEGYIDSRPKSGYFINDLRRDGAGSAPAASAVETPSQELEDPQPALLCDPSSFDFAKWKKCVNRVINEHPRMLLSESAPAGEPALRREIADYVYRARGVRCEPSQIVTAAGTQQVVSLLTGIFSRIGIRDIAVEEPGYLPVREIFRERGAVLLPVPVQEDGIQLEKLPENIRCAAYISPANQFPTGAVLPIGRRYPLLAWAERNDSYLIEDDYDSELRYFGRPIPSLQSLDQSGRVIYLGSFSATVFAAIRISYVILPPALARIFHALRETYAQTCSKMDQLTLALFMHLGYYENGLRRMRRLYARKLQRTEAFFESTPGVHIQSSKSGLHMLIRVASRKPAAKLCQEAASLGIRMLPASRYADQADARSLVFYYNRIPLAEIEPALHRLLALWDLS
ncbi:MAG: PLP-dependent aminotransferase family protein [Eubacteriales bacterium]|jgi:GntR family transcriptional regulator/MocR family aminotransferase|nr:PLP-dependent aminotransferase family protein [Eubacteriales bacterium]